MADIWLRAAILVNYEFRDMTTDIDALIRAASVMKDVINCVGDRYDLPNGWLNQNFVRTESFSPSLSQFSEYYKTYSNVMREGHFSELYAQTVIGEAETKALLIGFEQDYPGAIKEETVNRIGTCPTYKVSLLLQMQIFKSFGK